MLFASTTISNGACLGCVTATGMATEIGAIQGAVTEVAGERDSTPLQKKLDEFGTPWALFQFVFVLFLVFWVV